MKQKWAGVIGGYVVVALLGMVGVFVATAYLRAFVVQNELSKAEISLSRGLPGNALGHLDRARKWAPLYPVLEKKRLLLSIRCHTRRMDIPRATDDADAVLEAADRNSPARNLSSLVDFLTAGLVSITVLQPAEKDPLAAWDGYVTMIHTLRRHGRSALLPSIAEIISSRIRGGPLPPPVRAALQERPAPAVTAGYAPPTAPSPGVALDPVDVTATALPIQDAYETVPAARRELLVQRIRLQTEVMKLRKRLVEEAIAAGNPHAESYREAKGAYVAFWKRAKEAQALMAASTGDEHMKHADTLRMMKHEEVPIRQAYESSKKANDAWMEANGHQIEPAPSPELEQLEAELARVEQELKGP